MYVVSMQDQHDQQAGPSQQPFEAADTLYVVGDKPLEPTQQNPQPNKRARM
jgi:K+/H+ antiporter YhaU regulatory subunit KhtT